MRKNNEDAFLALEFDAREVRRLGKVGEATTANADFAFAVSDGMGGAMAGEYASKIAVEKITTLLPRSFQQSARGLNAGVCSDRGAGKAGQCTGHGDPEQQPSEGRR